MRYKKDQLNAAKNLLTSPTTQFNNKSKLIKPDRKINNILKNIINDDCGK